MPKESQPYRNISIKTEFANSIEEFIKANPQLGVNFRIYRQVLTDTTGKYQLLCANCHRIKTFEESLKKVK